MDRRPPRPRALAILAGAAAVLGIVNVVLGHVEQGLWLEVLALLSAGLYVLVLLRNR